MNKTLLAVTLALTAFSTVGFATSVRADSTTLVTIPTPVVRSLGNIEIKDTVVANNTDNNNYVDKAAVTAGVLPHVQLSYTQALHPGHVATLDAKVNLYDGKQFKLAVGTLGFANFKVTPQAYVVGGLYTPKFAVIGGAVRVTSRNTEAIAGVDYILNSRARVQLDYRTGDENFAGLGLCYAVTKQVSIEPAVLRANSGSNPYYGYVSVKFATKVF